MAGRVGLYSLDGARGRLRYGINTNASLIYFHHHIVDFTYLDHPKDTRTFHSELKLLRNELRSPEGAVTKVVAGDPFILEGVVLYSMEVTFKNTPCYPYMLLLQRGDHVDGTPYFFKKEETRDKAVAYINKVKTRDAASTAS